jgi:hypothetical protein
MLNGQSTVCKMSARLIITWLCNRNENGTSSSKFMTHENDWTFGKLAFLSIFLSNKYRIGSACFGRRTLSKMAKFLRNANTWLFIPILTTQVSSSFINDHHTFRVYFSSFAIFRIIIRWPFPFSRLLDKIAWFAAWLRLSCGCFIVEERNWDMVDLLKICQLLVSKS